MTTDVDERVRVYRAPTCSNCMRVVNHLRTRGIEFDDINVMTHPSALKDLEAIGAKCIPVVVKGNRHAVGQNLEQIDQLLGIDKQSVTLSTDQVARRIVTLIKAWARFATQLPPAAYHTVTPGMEGVAAFYMPNGDKFTLSDGRVYVPHGTYYGLVGHILRHARRARLVIQDPTSPIFLNPRLNAEYGEPLPEDELDVLLADGQDIIDCIESWWRETSGRNAEAVVSTYHGPRTVRQMLSVEAYSLAQHTRQLMTVLRMLDIEPDGPIGDADYEGLQLPADVWK